MVPALTGHRQPTVLEYADGGDIGELQDLETRSSRPSSSGSAGCFDEASFQHFAPLLAASQDYAEQSGFRFSSTSFDDLDSCSAVLAAATAAAAAGPQASPTASSPQTEEAKATERRLTAKLHAAPTVRTFAERLRRCDPTLSEELESAFRLVVAESSRNMMIATVKGLGLFPPCPPPAGIETDDCSYEDSSAPLPMIAQRLYNDQTRRLCNTADSVGGQLRRAQTAAFLVDFAHQAGSPVPPVPETYQAMLMEFSQRASEWSAAEEEKSARELSRSKEHMAQAGWLGRWQSAIWSVTGTLALGTAAKAEPLASAPSSQPIHSL